jgi:hypothetical protein
MFTQNFKIYKGISFIFDMQGSFYIDKHSGFVSLKKVSKDTIPLFFFAIKI